MSITRIILLLCFCFLHFLQAHEAVTFSQVSQLTSNEEEQHLLYNALNKSSGNHNQLIKAINDSKNEEERSAIVFLISYMPERDLRDLTAEFLLENTKWAFKSRNNFTWAKEIPLQIFLNDVLPYANFNEKRDAWRRDFYLRFAPLIKDCQTIEEAAKIVSENLVKVLKVKYSTKRQKADQSPYQSIDQGLASCTGLSILATDAFRAVGIPSRIAGTPSWTNVRGNHNWNEVWLSGRWFYTGYYAKGQFNKKDWMIERAGRADGTNWFKRIYAATFKPREGAHFPLVWDLNIRYVNAINRTDQYKSWWREFEALAAKPKISDTKTVAVVVYNKLGGSRIATAIEVYNHEKMIAKGKSRSAVNDMNNRLEFHLKVGEQYTFKYRDASDKEREKIYKVARKEQQKVLIYLDN